MEDNAPLYAFTYRVDKEGFTELNNILQDRLLSKSRKKTTRLGYAQLLIATAYVIAMVVSNRPISSFMMIVAVLIIFTGMYSVLYFPVFFKKKLQKVIDTTFAESEYLNNDITFRFYDTYCEEINFSDSRTMDYTKIAEVLTTEENIVILVERTGFCFPKTILDGKAEEFVAFLKERIDQ